MVVTLIVYNLLGFCLLAGKSSGASIYPRPEQQVVQDGTGKYERNEEIQDYLTRFGHMDVGAKDSVDLVKLRKAIKSLQNFAGLKVTGEMNNETRKLMLTPRCQVPDYSIANNLQRRRRYVASGKWAKNSLTYTFQTYPSTWHNISNATVEAIWTRALTYWSRVVPLVFSKNTKPPANIKVGFYSRNHGDSVAFDGRGGILAHSYLPTSGYSHYDDDESWTDGSSAGINLLQVMTHEIGHLIGLSHSSVGSAVMYPYYNGYIANFRLQDDDINGIQSLYGKILTTVAPATTNTPTTKNPPTTKNTPTTKKPKT